MGKATAALAALAERLARGKTRRSRPKVEAEIDTICAPRPVGRVLTTDLTGDTPATMRLTWRIDQEAHAALEEEIFGKRILVTDHDEWPLAHVIDAYRSQEDLEAGFRQAKDPHVVSFAPIRHFTDHKIRVHLFTCVLALALAHPGTDSDNPARAHSRRIRRCSPNSTASARPSCSTRANAADPGHATPSPRMTPNQQHLYKIFNLDRYTPKR